MSTSAPTMAQVPAHTHPVVTSEGAETGTLEGRQVETLQDIANYCIKMQNRDTRVINSLVTIVSLITAIAVGIILGVVLSPVAGILLSIPTFFIMNSLLVALAEKLRSRKFENTAAALESPDFIRFANDNQVALTRENVVDVHKAFLKFQDTQLKNIQTQAV